MKEDILEQLVDGYFLRKPKTFTKHNVKFKPNNNDLLNLSILEKSKYSVSSDIDVIAVHLGEENEKKVSAISCKSWQDGFDIDFFYEHLTDENKKKKRVGTSEAWKKFRELVEPIWAKSFNTNQKKQIKKYK
jgi:cytochrome c1